VPVSARAGSGGLDGLTVFPCTLGFSAFPFLMAALGATGGASAEGFAFGAVTGVDVSGLVFAFWDGASATGVDETGACDDCALGDKEES
jgi:hypothetical protein